MLELLNEGDYDFDTICIDQVLKVGNSTDNCEFINRIYKGILQGRKESTIGRFIVSYDSENCCELILYKRNNSSCGRYESGIIYIPGPTHTQYFREMIRFFAYDEDECFNVSNNYYVNLVDREEFIVDTDYW